MTTENDPPRIDFGAHLYPDVPTSDDNPDAALEEMLGEWNPEIILEQYRSAGLDGAVLSQPYYMGHGDVDAVADANDALLPVMEAYEQFYGLAAIPVAAGGEEAAAEFERCMENGYNGGALETKTEGIELVDDAVEPVFDVAEQYGAPILVHPKLDDSLHPDVLDDVYQLNAIFGREAALSESICRVVHQGVLDRHPDLNLVFHHLGGNIASMMGRIHLRLDQGRWPGQERVKPFEEFKAQFEERVYLDTSGFFGYHDPLRATLRQLPASGVLFATDAPYEPRTATELGDMVDAVYESASNHDADRVLGGNALDLLA